MSARYSVHVTTTIEYIHFTLSSHTNTQITTPLLHQAQ